MTPRADGDYNLSVTSASGEQGETAAAAAATAAALCLTGAEGRRLLADVADLPGDTPARLLWLRKRGVAPEIATQVVDIVAARHRARSRFPDADQLFLTSVALAQATSPAIAAYHAAGLAPFGTVVDLGCGIGMDAIALAEAGARVIAIEKDRVRLAFAQANAEVRGVADRICFRAGDVTTLDWEAEAVFWDPTRRDTRGRRVSRHGDQYEPPLSFLTTIRERVRGGCVKLSPALPDEALTGLDGRIEFLSDGRECKEACAWFGEARGAAGDLPGAAVLLPERLVAAAGVASPVRSLGAFVHDPDPALVRAGGLGTVAARFGLARISADDAYLTSDTPLTVPRFALSYRVLDAMPYRQKVVGRWLRERGYGRLVVKKRHFPKEPDAVAHELGLSGKDEEATLILVREGHGHRAILCEPCFSPSPTAWERGLGGEGG